MVVFLCFCVFVFLCLTLFHYTTSVVTINNSVFDNVVCCVFVFLCFGVRPYSTTQHQWIRQIIKYLTKVVCLCLCVFVFDLIHFTISVDTINNSIFDNGCVFVFMCFRVSVQHCTQKKIHNYLFFNVYE